MVNAWRLEYVPDVDPTHPLVVSDPLNAAAAGYAQYLADHSTATGHTADGQTVGQRAVQCGYPESIAFGDDTVAVVHDEAGASLTPQQAFDQMAAESYYQAHMRVPVQLGPSFRAPAPLRRRGRCCIRGRQRRRVRRDVHGRRRRLPAVRPRDNALAGAEFPGIHHEDANSHTHQHTDENGHADRHADA